MRCGRLTLPQLALLAAYVLILGGMEELGFADKPLIILAVGLTAAVGLVLSGQCLNRAEER